jgi:hypothetical protein
MYSVHATIRAVLYAARVSPCAGAHRVAKEEERRAYFYRQSWLDDAVKCGPTLASCTSCCTTRAGWCMVVCSMRRMPAPLRSPYAESPELLCLTPGAVERVRIQSGNTSQEVPSVHSQRIDPLCRQYLKSLHAEHSLPV